MKRLLLVLMALILLAMSACEKISRLVPTALASQTQDIVAQVEVQSSDVFSEIQHNIDLVTNLKTKVQQAQIKGEKLSLDDVIKDLQTVTTSYEKLSGQHQAIKSGLLKKIANIGDMQKSVQEEIATLQQKRANYVTQLSQVSDPNPDIVKSRQTSLIQAIKYVDSQVQLWTQFNGIEANINAEMSNLQKTIDSFLSVIDSSAIVFREGLNLLLLQRDINNALSLFTQDLPAMTQLSSDMTASWANLDYLVQMLTSTVSIKTP